ncbi:MAG TPA: ATP-binding protein [Chitinophagaceae bacterium]
MFAQRFKYLMLVIFLLSIIVIVYLQYNSGKSIKNLITDNEILLKELQIKTKLQKLQTDIIFSESALRDLITNNDEHHVRNLNSEYGIIQGEMADIDSAIRTPRDNALLDQLRLLADEKIENGHQVLNVLYVNGADSALNFIRTRRGRAIRDSIIQTIRYINNGRQTALSNVSASVSTNSVRARSLGIILAIVASLASLAAFWYLVEQGQRQQRLIRTLDTSEKKLKEASKIQEQFIANMSHEIRTPMNAVLGFAGLLQKTTLDKNQQEYVRSIRSSAENLLTIINDILDFSRIESGMMHIEKLPFNVRELVDSIRTMMSVKAANLHLYLRAEIDDAVPLLVKGDAVRLTQILINLISNALKFSHEGGVTVKVTQAAKTDDFIRLSFSITDTGIGIDPTKQKTIFERFHQEEPGATRRYGGTGLGLSIVKQLVEIQNGIITVVSQPGKGSEFTVTLPYQVVSDAEVSTASASKVVVDPELGNTNILVAEDNTMNQKLMRFLLEQWGVHFDIVPNGAVAVDTLRQNPQGYQLLLMDIQMPELDGYTATEKIRNDLHLNIPIIAMTAHALTGEKEKCLGAGMDDYISKPLNEEQLYKLIVRYAGKANGNVTPGTGMINMAYLQSISGGDASFEKNMIRTFSRQLPAELEQLDAGILRGDFADISTAAHHMKSTVGYMGLDDVRSLLEKIELAADQNGNLQDISNHFAVVKAACQLVAAEARAIVS